MKSNISSFVSHTLAVLATNDSSMPPLAVEMICTLVPGVGSLSRRSQLAAEKAQWAGMVELPLLGREKSSRAQSIVKTAPADACMFAPFCPPRKIFCPSRAPLVLGVAYPLVSITLFLGVRTDTHFFSCYINRKKSKRKEKTFFSASRLLNKRVKTR